MKGVPFGPDFRSSSERTAAIKAGSNVDKQHECIYVGWGIKDGRLYDPSGAFDQLKSEYLGWQLSIRAQILRVGHMISIGMTLGQVGMVLAGLDALSGLSDLLYIWETGEPDISVTISERQ